MEASPPDVVTTRGRSALLGCAVGGVVVYGLSTVVQFNDPDPLWWVAVYGAACVLSLAFALRRRVTIPALLLAALAGLWALTLAPDAIAWLQSDGDVPLTWQMPAAPEGGDVGGDGQEVARETGGLLLVVGGMLLMALLARLSRRPS